MTREVEAARTELSLARNATATVAASSAAAVSVADGTHIKELQGALDSKSRELAEAVDR